MNKELLQREESIILNELGEHYKRVHQIFDKPLCDSVCLLNRSKDDIKSIMKVVSDCFSRLRNELN